MKHIVPFSGGKDSLATMLWAKKNLSEFEVVFCDTGWESPVTYQYIKVIEAELGITVKHLRSPKHKGLLEMAEKQKLMPSAIKRTCTSWLKVYPMIDYVLSLNEDTVIYQGIRADESMNRSKMKAQDEFFASYVEGSKNNKYRRKDVLAYIDKYSVDVMRPVFLLSAEEVFKIIFEAGLEPNPLYKDGFKRVGCFPCVLCAQGEIKIMIERYPERLDEIRAFEERTGMTFFGDHFIPEWARTKRHTTKAGKVKMLATVDDVVKYLTEYSGKLFDFGGGCQSAYNICE